MPGCAVFGCSNYSRKTKGTDIKYYSFPKNKIQAKKWIHACRRKDNINLKNACICSIHFEPSNFELPLQQQLLDYQPKSFRNLKAEALPTLHLPLSSNKASKPLKPLNTVQRRGRLIKRNRHTKVNQILESSSNTVETVLVMVDPLEPLLEIKTEPQEDLISIETKRNRHTKVNQILEPSSNTVETVLVMVDSLEPQLEIKTEPQEDLISIETLQNKILLLEAENSSLKMQLEQHEEEKKVLKKELLTSKNEIPEIIRKRLEEIFTPGQLKVFRLCVLGYFTILTDVIKQMKTKSKNMNKMERLVVLTLDGIYISNRIMIEKKNEQKMGPHKSCQVIMAWGLVGNFIKK